MDPSNGVQIPQRLVELLHSAPSIVVLTGAGISAESSVPTFRQKQISQKQISQEPMGQEQIGQSQSGLWSRYDPEELATPQAFRRNPELVWRWYTWRRELISGVAPNAGHQALVEMEQHFPQFTLITQNVDGLHQQAGSRRVIELHGNIQRNKCFAENRVVGSWSETGEIPPRCPVCGGMLRPDVVWFGESLPQDALESAWKAASNCQVFFSIGTSGIVEPAASLPYIALHTGAVVVEINPNPTPLTAQATYVLPGPAGSVLPELLAALSRA